MGLMLMLLQQPMPMVRKLEMLRTVHFDHEILRSKACLDSVQNLLEEEGFSEELFDRELQARKEYDTAIDLQEKLWSEKSRDKWLKYGDRCTKYFHTATRSRRIRNAIREIITEDGSVLKDANAIGDHMVAHFESFFKGGASIRDEELLAVIPSVVSNMDNDMLTSIPSQEEIKAAVFDLDPSSAPGPDGFSDTFFRVCWEIIGVEVCRGIQNFFKDGIITKGVNCNFMCLIPKVEGANRVGQFRPLCLGNFFLKIIPKIMATRLSSLLHKLISPEQGAFQRGKVIFENIGVASELANMVEIKCRGGGMGMKLDVQKAFDTLEWGFLFDVLGVFAISQRWIHWLHQILLSTRISVLINGGPASFFGMERGLRQGDPLSPLLFILSEEILCRGLNALRERGCLKPLTGPRQVSTPSHLLYADDLFIFMKAEIANVRRVKQFMEAYRRYSGQVINLAKSKVFLGSISSTRKWRLETTLQIPVCTFPTKYLGVILKKGRVKSDMFLPLLDQFKQRLAAWKGRLLSLAGRIELVRSVMCSIPVHNFSVYLWPADAILKMERWIGNFIWTGEADCSKVITVKWDNLCKPKREGGVGIRRLRELNLALIAKLAWTIRTDKSTFASFLRGRFVKKDGSLKNSVGSSTLLPGLQKVWSFVQSAERWVVGNGDSISFWYDKWINNQSIEDLLHPNQIPSSLCAKVAAFMEEGRWTLPTTMDAALQNVFNIIQGLNIKQSDREDCRYWAHSKSGIFSVKTAWDELRVKKAKPAWHWAVWNRDLHPRSSVFGWRLAHGALPTDNKICSRMIPMVSRCELCLSADESEQHLFIDCVFSGQIWSEVLWLFNETWTGFPSIELLFSWWRRKFRIVPLPKAWEAMLIIICQQLWMERNRRRFDNIRRPSSQVTKLCFREVMNCYRVQRVQIKSIQDLVIARTLQCVISNPPTKKIIEVRWRHPPAGWLKLNIDGSSLGNPGPLGAGGIIRDQHGNVIICFADYQGVGSNYMAELGALLMGVKKAQQMNIENLWVESDSKAVVSAILSRSIPWSFMQAWWSISSYLDIIQWRITHYFHEANSTADALANHAARERTTTFWSTTPTFVAQVWYAPHLPLVLRGLTCTFSEGIKIGIVGRMGSGKSTLVQALFHMLEPTTGQIWMDDINIFKIDIHNLRSRLSIIPQDPTMFEGTLRSNLDPLGDYTDEQIWEVGFSFFHSMNTF
ncbi:uncharacterized protein LOC122653468 [Telopea speciosissima]|uniref:uncharacterized protein LOC122653468 n=1 Tax=Telopea speciosissima TaxID=54955 RepID=UPI001CC3C603|nr:uncharacterized protein LOC122653468 [Telopea speciosissima]